MISVRRIFFCDPCLAMRGVAFALLAGCFAQLSSQTAAPAQPIAHSENTRLTQSPPVSNSPPLNPPQVGQANGSAPIPNDASHQGVTLHGRWIIDIKNADGTLAQHREFENSLTTSGTYFLTGLLSGYEVRMGYLIVLQPSTVPGSHESVCSGPGLPLSQQCGIVATTDPDTDPYYDVCRSGTQCFPGLTIAYTTDNTGLFSSMVLAGTFAATTTGNIAQVGTDFAGCYAALSGTGPDQAPGRCSFGNVGSGSGLSGSEVSVGTLSSASIPQINIIGGQIVSVTVIITFS